MKSFEEIRVEIYKKEYKPIIELLKSEKLKLQKEYVDVKYSAEVLRRKLKSNGINLVEYPETTECERIMFSAEPDVLPVCKIEQLRNEVRKKYDDKIVELQNCIGDLKTYIKKYKLFYRNGTIALMSHKENEPTEQQLHEMLIGIGRSASMGTLHKQVSNDSIKKICNTFDSIFKI